MDNCPCGSHSSYATCCEPIISGNRVAETAEQMMRARYTAHDKVEIDFIFNSTHPDSVRDTILKDPVLGRRFRVVKS